jgi:hypothetical protein
MSGGHFNDNRYIYYEVGQFANELEEEILHNGKAGTDGDHSNYYSDYNEEVIGYLKEQVPKLRKMEEIMRAIDYLYSGDYSEDSFMNRIEELNKN